jgi:glycosyltransferase involved in cell wall biosynthesis
MTSATLELPLSVLHTESSCGWGGQEIRVLNEATGMQARGHQVGIACPEQSAIFEQARRRGLMTLALPIARKRWPGILALRHSFQHGPDGQPWQIINSHSSTDSWLSALALASLPGSVQRPRPALVRTRHISSPIGRNLSTRWLYGRASAHVVTTGEALRVQVMQQTGLSGDRVTSIPTGIDLAQFQPLDTTPSQGNLAQQALRQRLGLPADRFIIGIVATLRSWKGHRYLVEAMQSLLSGSSSSTAQRPYLLIVGDGPGREPLGTQIQALGLQQSVQMVGNQQDVVPWLQCLDVFALPSYANEGVPQAIMQAMACALPVITTHVGAIGEVASHDQTALLVTPQSSSALAQAIAQLQADRGLRQRLALAGHEQACKRFAQSLMLERMEQVFRQARKLRMAA